MFFLWFISYSLGLYVPIEEGNLTLSQTTNFRLFQTKKFVDKNFKFDENGRKFFDRVENTVGKGEIARNE